MLVFAAAFACNALGALVAGPTRVRKAAALGLSGVPPILAAAFPPEGALLRCWVWVGSFFLLMRMFDVLAECRRPAIFRLGLMLCVLDLRTLRREPPGVDLPLVARGLAFGALAAAGVAAVTTLTGPVRLLGAAVLLYAGMETVDALYRLPIRLAGGALRPLQDMPVRSRSLGEFWGRRWNREVGGLLFRWCFRPLARRGHARLGLAWAFTWSGLLHAVGVLVTLGWREALLVQAFFMLHGVAVAAERAIRVSRWPVWAAHAWVVAVFVVTAPLFLDPALKVIGLGSATAAAVSTHLSD